MKTNPIILLVLVSAGFACAEVRTWTRSDGKTAQMELLSVVDREGGKAGQFKMANGTTATVKASALIEADAKILNEWKPAGSKASVFDKVLDGNLEKLDRDKLQPYSGMKRPSKYYLFYHTASWCGPCQAYTPVLVDFYNKHKNDNFEIILITHDEDKRGMEAYAKSKKMPWPHLNLKSVRTFNQSFDQGVTGIPSLITCDLEGKIVSRTESPAELEILLK